MQTWLEVYAADFDGHWVHWKVDGRVVGGCLLLVRVIKVKGVPLRSVFVNSAGIASAPTPLTEFNDVLHLPGYKYAISASLTQLMLRKAWSRFFFSGYQEGGVCAALLMLLPAAHVEHETRPAPYVNLTLVGDRVFQETLSGNTGTRIRKNRRLYEEQLGPLTVCPAGSVEEALQFFGEMRTLHLARWSAKGEATTLASPRVVDFHEGLIRRLWSGGHVDLLRIGTQDAAIGYLYNFVVERKVFFMQSGFRYEPEDSRSPGMLTHTLAIEHYRLRGIREYDFMAGDSRYKRSLSNANRDLHWSVLYRNQLRARAFLLGRSAWSRLVEKRLAVRGA
jgi:hypothetical protein